MKLLSLVTNFMLLNVYLLWLNFEFLVYFRLYKLNQRAHNEFNLNTKKNTNFFPVEIITILKSAISLQHA